MVKHLVSSERAEKITRLLNTYDGIGRLISGLFFVLILAHFTACMWYFTAKMDDFNPDTWVVRYNMIDKADSYLYLIGLYWAITVLTTVGFGDISAFTPAEIFLSILWMLFGIGFYSFVVGSLTSVISSIDE